jgi:hypothetical protein
MKSSSTDSSRASALYVATLIGSVLAFCLVIEGFLRTVAIERSDRPRRVRAVYESPLDDVVLGDSTFDMLFEAGLLRDFENLSPRGATALELEHYARAYYRFREPGRVIVLAGSQLFGPARREGGSRGSEDHYGQLVGLPFAIYAFEPGISRSLAETGRFLPAWLTGRLEPWSPPVYQGPMWWERSEADRAKHRRNRLERTLPRPGFMAESHVAAYRRLLVFLRERGARVCMLRSPLAPGFRAATDAHPLAAKAQRTLRSWADEFQFRYVDPAELALRLTNRDFLNADHLTDDGARRFVPRALATCFPEES